MYNSFCTSIYCMLKMPASHASQPAIHPSQNSRSNFTIVSDWCRNFERKKIFNKICFKLNKFYLQNILNYVTNPVLFQKFIYVCDLLCHVVRGLGTTSTHTRDLERLIEVCCTFNISKDIGSIVYNKGHNLNRNDHIHSRLHRVATSLNNVCIEQFLWFETVIF